MINRDVRGCVTAAVGTRLLPPHVKWDCLATLEEASLGVSRFGVAATRALALVSLTDGVGLLRKVA